MEEKTKRRGEHDNLARGTAREDETPEKYKEWKYREWRRKVKEEEDIMTPA